MKPVQQNMSDRHDFTAEARILGYYPFVRLSPLEYLTLRELHGAWIFEELLPRLHDPSNMDPHWTISFCAVAASMRREKLKDSTDIHALVIRDPAFKERGEHLSAFKKVFFGSIWQKVKDGTLDLPGWGQSIARQDQDRWRLLLADRQRKIHEKRAKDSQDPVKKPMKNDRRAWNAPVLVVVKNPAMKSKSKPAAQNVWRNPRPCEPLEVKRRI